MDSCKDIAKLATKICFKVCTGELKVLERRERKIPKPSVPSTRSRMSTKRVIVLYDLTIYNRFRSEPAQVVLYSLERGFVT